LGATKTYRAVGLSDRLWTYYNRIAHPVDYQKYETEHFQYLEKHYPGRVEVTHSHAFSDSGFIGRFFGNLFGRLLPVLLLGLLALSTIPVYFYLRKNGLTGRTVFPRQPIENAYERPIADATIAVHRQAPSALPGVVAQPIGYTDVRAVSSAPIHAPGVAEVVAPLPQQHKSADAYTQQPIGTHLGAPVMTTQQRVIPTQQPIASYQQPPQNAYQQQNTYQEQSNLYPQQPGAYQQQQQQQQQPIGYGQQNAGLPQSNLRL